MDIENFIEGIYREFIYETNYSDEHKSIYSGFNNEKLRDIMSTLHSEYIILFSRMNQRLPAVAENTYFWADDSRRLINAIDITQRLEERLQNTDLSFHIDAYYKEVITGCGEFLKEIRGSILPVGMQKIDVYYIKPIFIQNNIVQVRNLTNMLAYPMEYIVSGSYADVFKYFDQFYRRLFVVKRAKSDLDDKELERFRLEYNVMSELSSPYVAEVYCYNGDKNEYIMEYMDYTLDEYISIHGEIKENTKRNIVGQILRAFEYLHSRGKLHRDISTTNILIKEYHDCIVVKIADFGLVKVPGSTLTSQYTEMKGSLNDPALAIEGFNTYNIKHEMFALTRIVAYVMTGNTRTWEISEKKLRSFVDKGTNVDKSKRYSNVGELREAFKVAMEG